jgi:hypothetical protein
MDMSWKNSDDSCKKCGKRLSGRGCFLERPNGSPVVFLAFGSGETASPERSGGECGGGKISPRAKASENKGAEVWK